MYMVMFVLDDADHLDDVLSAWESIGITGSTIIESTGMNRQRVRRQIGKSFMAGINRIIETGEEGHLTLFVIVSTEQMVRACLEAAESVVGNLDDPNTGVLAAWPVTIVKGIPEPPAVE